MALGPFLCLLSILSLHILILLVPVEGDYLAVIGALQKTWLLFMLWYREQFHLLPLGLDKLHHCAPHLKQPLCPALPHLLAQGRL